MPVVHKRSGVYVIENVVNGKLYIGSAVDIGSRWGVHRFSLRHKKEYAHRKLFRAWHKYGEGAFCFRVLLQCSPQDLLFFEQRAIDILKPSYNIALVAGSQLGLKRSLSSKLKMRKPHGPLSIETRQRMSVAQKGHVSGMKGKHHSLASRAKMSLAQSNRLPPTTEVRAHISRGLLGRQLSPESRAKISAAIKTLGGRPHTEETKRKLSELAKRRNSR